MLGRSTFSPSLTAVTLAPLQRWANETRGRRLLASWCTIDSQEKGREIHSRRNPSPAGPWLGRTVTSRQIGMEGAVDTAACGVAGKAPARNEETDRAGDVCRGGEGGRQPRAPPTTPRTMRQCVKASGPVHDPSQMARGSASGVGSSLEHTDDAWRSRDQGRLSPTEEYSCASRVRRMFPLSLRSTEPRRISSGSVREDPIR